MRECIMLDRLCNNCGRCNYCDIESTKICNNCCKCIGEDNAKMDYKVLEISEIEEGSNYSFTEKEQKLYFKWLKKKNEDKKKIN